MEVSFEQAHKQVLQHVEQEAKSRTVRAANAIKKASNKILSNTAGRSGRVYRKSPGSKATYTASAPGEPPALRSGDLRRSWQPLPVGEMTGSGKVYTPGIHTDVKYAPLLQDGTSKMAARPFEEPIKKEAWPEVKAIYEKPYF